MKSSRAFYATFKFITEMTNKIFSLGYDRLNYCNRIWPIPLYLIGKLAKYVIGYPLGIVAGLFAAGIVGIVKIFKDQKANDDEKEVYSTSNSPTFNPKFNELKKEGMQNLFLSSEKDEFFLEQDNNLIGKTNELEEDFVVSKKETTHLSVLSDELNTDIKKKAKIYQSALNEKKVKLLNKIDLLGV